MSGRSAKAARRALAARYAASTPTAPITIDVDKLHAEAIAVGWRPSDHDLRPHDIHARLGRKAWTPPVRHGEAGWRFQRYDNTLLILVSVSCWPELPDVPIIHASISRHTPYRVADELQSIPRIPTYADLQLLHRAVWPDGHAIQCFVPASDHVNIRDVLHLWGRADNEPLWPINFGRFGTI